MSWGIKFKIHSKTKIRCPKHAFKKQCKLRLIAINKNIIVIFEEEKVAKSLMTRNKINFWVFSLNNKL